MSANPNKVKLKLNTAAARDAPQESPTPATAGGLKISFNKKPNTAATPTGAASKMTSAAKSKQTPKKASAAAAQSKKRALEDGDAINGSASKRARSTSKVIRLSQTPVSAKPSSLIRLQSNKKQPTTPTGQTRIKIKAKGKVMPRPDGVGYDSEASDAEEDPVMQDNFILRMPPGPDCDLVRRAVEEKKIHLPVSAGGLDVHMRFFSKDARRAAIFVEGRIYAAVLVDLPCIIESMKSWDKKSWMKSADICQMMLVIGRVDNEEAARTFPLPKPLDAERKLYDWPHGLTPPMHNVRKRRFRRRVNVRTIEAAEERVEELLRKDEEARAMGGKTTVEPLDLAKQQEDEEQGDYGSEEEDAEGEYDEEMDDAEVEYEIDEDDEDHEASIARALGEDFEMDFEDGDASTPARASDPNTAAQNASAEAPLAAESPAAAADSPAVDASMDEGAAEGDDEGEDDEDEDEDEDEDSEEDEDEEIEEDDATRERAQYVAQTRDEIENLKEKIRQKKAEEASKNSLALKARIQAQIKSLQEDLAVKKGEIGEADEDDEDGA